MPPRVPRPYPLGSAVTVEELDRDPHPMLARLREHEPVSWTPALDGWLVTRHELALQVMRDASTFTVDDPRFSTAQVIGPSMLSLDGEAHRRNRAPFLAPFRPRAVAERFANPIAAEAERLVQAMRAAGGAELRRSFAGPLAAAIVGRALGLGADEAATMLGWYDGIVSAVTRITAGSEVPDAGRRGFEELRARLLTVIEDSGSESLLVDVAHGSTLTREQIVSNAAVLLFGGIETTEGMIANATLHLLERPDALERVRSDPRLLDRAIEESLRLEPAAAVVDRYATAAVELGVAESEGAAEIRAGELVRVSIAAANRDPAVFPDPDRFDLDRGGPQRHLAFAHGPHVCVGVHLARLEARTALATLLDGLPGLRLDPRYEAAVRGLVFRKPRALHVLWDGEDR